MRRMNYPRFDKPTYVGTYNDNEGGFVLDTTKGFFPSESGDPEPGIYFVIIKDTEALQQYSCTLTIDIDLNTNSSWYIPSLDDMGKIYFIPGDGPIITAGPARLVANGSTIELYKLD